MNSKNNETKKKCCWMWSTIGFAILLIAYIVIGGIAIQHINKLDKKITRFKIEYIKNSEIQTVDPSLEFLKNEIKEHQDFIERERSFLIWMLGVILSGGVFILGFLGYKRKQDIEEIIEKEYRKEVQKQFEVSFSETIGGDDKKQFLEMAIEREENAFSKRICFFTQSERLETQIKLFDDLLRPYDGSVKKIDFKDDNFNETKLNEYDKYGIFVYEVGKNEDENVLKDKIRKSLEHDNDNDLDKAIDKALEDIIKEQNYKKLNDWCKAHEKQCVLYCPDNLRLKLTSIYDDVTTTVQFASKLRETLYILLFFAPNK